MKKIFIILTLAAGMLAAGCQTYDDSELKSEIQKITARLTALEQQCSLMNSNISTLQALVDALDGQDGIVSVTDLEDGTGYSIKFKSGKTVTLRDGVDGRTPAVGVRQDTDGTYYWTVDGEWLLDASGKKVRAQAVDGKDAVAPKLKIEDDWWYISYDGGSTWTKLYQAKGDDGDTLFASVTDNGETVTFKLADGTVLTVPKATELGIQFTESVDIGISAGETRSIGYILTGASENTAVKAFGQYGWKARVVKAGATMGTIEVTAPSPLEEGEIIVLVYEGDSKTVVRILNFVKGVITAPQASYSLIGKAENLMVPVQTNVDYSVEIPQEATWLTYTGSVPGTKAMRSDSLSFLFDKNIGPDVRTAVVTVKDGSGNNEVKITFTQNVWDYIDITDSNLKAALVAGFDKNGDGEISISEAAAATSVSVAGKGIKDLTGLEYFSNITSLDCSGNSITSVSLSGHPNLKVLNVSGNSLTDIDLSGVSLTALNCSGNSLTSLDLSSQTSLSTLDCGSVTGLTTLDLTSCAQTLETLNTKGCTSLATIYVLKTQTIKSRSTESATKLLVPTPDGTVTTLQTHTVGNGVRFVIIGDGFMKNTNASEYDGGRSKFDTWANTAMEAIFAEEPYKTFRNRFDIYSVAVESSTETFDGTTAIACKFGTGTYISGNTDTAFSYASKVSGTELDKTVVLVILNSTKYAGTCYYWSTGKAVAYIPMAYGSADRFGQLVRHEAAGHGFAKLSDEYSYSGTIPSSEVLSHKWWYAVTGAGANVDVTSDQTSVHWAKFLSDSRYTGQVGVYEGALTFQYGAYRPTQSSIMRYNTGGYNAPSREAIYKRIMTISEGSGWEYDYETFVAYDAINRSASSQAYYRAQTDTIDEANFIPTAPPVLVE